MSFGMFLSLVALAGFLALSIMGFFACAAVHWRVKDVFTKSPALQGKPIYWNGYENKEKHTALARYTFWFLLSSILNILILFPVSGLGAAFFPDFKQVYFESCLKLVCEVNKIDKSDLDATQLQLHRQALVAEILAAQNK